MLLKHRESFVRDQGVGGSNPLAPINPLKEIQPVWNASKTGCRHFCRYYLFTSNCRDSHKQQPGPMRFTSRQVPLLWQGNSATGIVFLSWRILEILKQDGFAKKDPETLRARRFEETVTRSDAARIALESKRLFFYQL